MPFHNTSPSSIHLRDHSPIAETDYGVSVGQALRGC
jgi:hypothetical protein